jgi:hypothetical protein
VPDTFAGDEITRDHWPAAKIARNLTAIDDISNTSFAAGTACELTFTAPYSGRVAVVVQGGIDQDSAGNRAFITYELYLGSDATGTLVVAAKEANGISSNGGPASNDLICGNLTMVAGLTGGSTYFVRAMHRTEGGATNDITFRKLIVFPVS